MQRPHPPAERTAGHGHAEGDGINEGGLSVPPTNPPGTESFRTAWEGKSPTDLAEALASIEAFVLRYVAFPSVHESVAIALWIVHAHLVEQFEVSPILSIMSSEMRSGKTRLLDCIELSVANPFRTVTPSDAVVYTVLARRPRPTLLLDEVDAIFGARTAERHEGLRAILNSGNRRGTPVHRVRLDGPHREVEEFDVFGPKAIAGIGKLPNTVADRAIPIRMRRRAPDELVCRFRQRIAAAEAERLTFDWTSVTIVPDVTVPDALNDRAADSWEPLLAIADAAGAGWPDRARAAALALSIGEDEDRSIGVTLLEDVREVFGDLAYLSTAELLQRLWGLDDAPWSDWFGKRIAAQGLAQLLKPYRVGPVRRRVAGPVTRGYFRAQFEDAFKRYLPAGPSQTSQPAQLGKTTSPRADPEATE
jgi:hypothetical protein